MRDGHRLFSDFRLPKGTALVASLSRTGTAINEGVGGNGYRLVATVWKRCGGATGRAAILFIRWDRLNAIA